MIRAKCIGTCSVSAVWIVLTPQPHIFSEFVAMSMFACHIDLLTKVRLEQSSLSSVSAARLAAKTLLVQALPVSVPIIDHNLSASLYALANEDYPLRVEPGEFRELGVRFAAMIDEPREVTLSALPYLVASSLRRAVNNVQMPNVFGH